MKTLIKNKEYKKLHAEWYDLMSATIDNTDEINFWINSIQLEGQPVLELGSGTGRILIPLLENGFDVTGIDTSPDMVNRCYQSSNIKGLKPDVIIESILNFELPRKFNLIMLDSAGLGLFVNDNDIHKMFERVTAHLKPGGLFIFEFEQVPAEYNKDNKTWKGDWLAGDNQTVISWRNKIKYNSDTHIWNSLFIVEKFIDGCLIETEANEREGRFFSIDEAVNFAESKEFKDIKVTNWLTEEPPSKDSKVITVHCRKPL
jgi:SAM-dependent methyltransferase